MTGEPYLTPAEAAGLFKVDPKTVTRWAEEGRLTVARTLGGHRRYLRSEVVPAAAAYRRSAGRSLPGRPPRPEADGE